MDKAGSAHWRPGVLALCEYFLPSQRAGGPAKSVHAIARALGADCTIRIVSRDRDRGDRAPYPETPTGRDLQRFGVTVHYVAPGVRGYLGLATLLAQADVVYLNSLFSPAFGILPVLLRRAGKASRARFIIAPRGELAPAALQLKKRKKRFWLHVGRMLGLYRGMIWHAASEQEAADLRQALVRHLGLEPAPGDIVVARPPVRLRISDAAPPPKRPGMIRIAFLSRISRIKNLDLAIRAVSMLRGDVRFDIYGPAPRDDDGRYLAECQALAADAPANVQIEFKGEVKRNEVIATLANYHVFLLLTGGENFGHVIAEAMAAGCLLCISDRTPWRDLAADGIGWDLPLRDAHRLQQVLGQVVDMDAAAMNDAVARVRGYALTRLDDDAAVIANRALFSVGQPRDTSQVGPGNARAKQPGTLQ